MSDASEPTQAITGGSRVRGSKRQARHAPAHVRRGEVGGRTVPRESTLAEKTPVPVPVGAVSTALGTTGPERDAVSMPAAADGAPPPPAPHPPSDHWGDEAHRGSGERRS